MRYILLFSVLFALSLANIVANLVQNQEDNNEKQLKDTKIAKNNGELEVKNPEDEFEINMLPDEGEDHDEIEDNVNEFVEERIIGGHKAKRNSFPFQVGLNFVTAVLMYSYCGGVLITRKHVLTAALCVKDQAAVYVLMGAHNRFNSRESGRVVQIISAVNFIQHSGYDPNTHSNDIAIIKLIETVKLNSKIQTIQLARCSAKPSNFKGEKVVISGWGHFIGNKRYLRFADEKIISNDVCRRTFPNVDERNICVNEKKKQGACRGDSGGPVTYKKSGKRYLIGLVSHGTDGCSTRQPSVFTFIPSFCDWILQRIY